jgi:hypothetical protein
LEEEICWSFSVLWRFFAQFKYNEVELLTVKNIYILCLFCIWQYQNMLGSGQFARKTPLYFIIIQLKGRLDFEKNCIVAGFYIEF